MTQFVSYANQVAVMKQDPTPRSLMSLHKEQIYTDLRRLGAATYNMWLPETHTLPNILHADERLQGIVYGHYQQKPNDLSNGRGCLIVTNKRVLLIDKKPLFLRCDEIPRDIISGVTYTKAGITGTVTLHTKAGDFAIRTFNQKCATHFVKACEFICFKQEGME